MTPLSYSYKVFQVDASLESLALALTANGVLDKLMITTTRPKNGLSQKPETSEMTTEEPTFFHQLLLLQLLKVANTKRESF